MPVMLERWNDDRMDALDAKVDDLGDRMDQCFAQVAIELREQRRELREQQKETNARLDGMQRAMVMAAIAIPGSFAAVIGLAATQL